VHVAELPFKSVVFESLPREIIGVTWLSSRTGCISNRGRQHFELNRVTPSVTKGHDRVCLPEPVVFQIEGDNTLS
jgi:hypothetical protein